MSSFVNSISLSTDATFDQAVFDRLAAFQGTFNKSFDHVVYRHVDVFEHAGQDEPGLM